jgi:hypothetical protein
MKMILLLLGLSASVLMQAQVAITVDNNAGKLSTLFTAEQLSSVTDLTITGTIDANDIAIINSAMPALTTLDMSSTTLSACEVPSVGNFEANWFPGPTLIKNSLNYGGLNKPLLISILLPSTLKILGSNAFEHSGLTTITIPSSVTSIGWSAFAHSTITSITIPPSVSYLDEQIFDGCTKLIKVVIEAALTAIPQGTFADCSALTSVNIPSTVTHIGISAFSQCSSLNSILLPSAVSSIDMTAFNGCTGLTSIYSNNPVPPQTQSSFEGVDKANCILHVPFGSAEVYAAAPEWKDFTNIVEEPSLSLSSNTVALAPEINSTATISLTTLLPWTITSNQEWLTVSPAAGNHNETITFTAQENPLFNERKAIITVSTNDGYSETVTVTQSAKANTAPVANAGSAQTVNEGDIVQLDGSASIDTDGNELTYLWTAPEGITLSSNTAAKPTFTAPLADKNMEYSFTLVVNDGTSNSPEAHVVITVLNKAELSVSSNTAAVGAAENLSATVDIHCNAAWEAVSDQSWLTVNPASSEGNQQLTLTAQANSLLTSRTAIVTITSASLKETITITQSAKANTAPVANAGGAQTVNEGDIVQLDGSASTDTDGNELTYLWTAPEGITLSSNTAAKPTFTAPQVEVTTQYPFTLVVNDGTSNSPGSHVIISVLNKVELSVSSNTATVGAEENLSATVDIHCNAAWETVSDQSWLTVNPASSEGNQQLTLTAQANSLLTSRTAIVSVTSGPLMETITITQSAKANTAPVANGGSDKSFNEGDIVQLDGSASTDADGNELTYLWTAPEGITISSNTAAKPTFTAPEVEVTTQYTFTLVVNDGQVNSASDVVIITITNKIIEMYLSISAVNFEGRESTARIVLSGNAQWTAISDQSWLTVSPTSGTGDKILTIKALANNTNKNRTGTITVSAPGVDSKNLVVTQNGLYVGIEETTLAPTVNYYPNPFCQEMNIEIANTLHQEVSVDVYAMTGQKIRSLVRQRKDEHISITWDGTNEMGQMVPYGIYLMKINNETRKVVFNGR